MTRAALLRWGGICLAALAAAFLLYHFLTAPSRARKETAVATATALTADASKQAAQDSVKILVETQAAHGRIDVITKGNRDAILSAPGAAVAVGPAAHRAGLDALCLRNAYRLQPACVGLLDADPVTTPQPGAGGTAP
ncbi:hypothetical protein [Sphingomonas sp.]|uniref:hypothetical protein n=1 Tax=Sphingomonas sp. TaxID=28214 RepID=UPI002ED891BA